MKILKVFPRKTKATPDDAIIARSPELFDQADEVHISVAFSYDMKKAEQLYNEWKYVAQTKIGGPATGEKSGDFIPGMYLKNGYVITSRGCNNNCWFCSVPKREGKIREIKITDGHNVLDDNLLACSDEHVKKVFNMLSKQKSRPVFSGGLEAKILKSWHAEELFKLKPKQVFFAYDTEDDFEHIYEASVKMACAGFSYKTHTLRCYVLIGYPLDTIDKAEKRLNRCMDIGIIPMAMLWKDKNGLTTKEWRSFQRKWARPQIICSNKFKLWREKQ